MDNRTRINEIAQFVIHPPEYPRIYAESGLQLIRSQNVRPEGIDIAANKVFLAPEALKNKRVIRPGIGDLLIVRSGVNAGDMAMVEGPLNNCMIGADTLLARFKNEITPKFLQVFFWTNLGEFILSRYITGATNKHVSPHSFNKIEVPEISLDRQMDVVAEFEKVLHKKRSKEKQAREILAGITGFLLEELGIQFPQQENDGTQYRAFKTRFSKVTGNRFDPKRYSKETENLYNAIESARYDKVPLKSLITHSVAGNWGNDPVESYNEKLWEKCLVIRATEFDNDFNLRLENSRAKYRLISKARRKKMDIRQNDLLLEKSGGSPDQPVGRVALLDADILGSGTLCFSNFIHKFRTDNSRVVPEYLFCFLKFIHTIKLTDAMQSQTNGIRNLIMREYWNQSIVLPDIGEQKKIAAKYFELKTKARALLQEMNDEFTSSRKEIEDLILA